MSAADRPAMVGYFRETFLMSPAEQDRVRRQLIDFAEREGSRMTAIYTEALDTQPAAIEALIETVRRGGVPAVAVTESLAEQYRRRLEDSGIRVLIAVD